MRYLDSQGLSLYPNAAYIASLDISYDLDLADLPEQRFLVGDVVITGPWGKWAWLPKYVLIEVVPDGTEVTRLSPLVYALRERGVSPANATKYAKKPPSTKSPYYKTYLDALAWASSKGAYSIVEVGPAPAPYKVVTDPIEAVSVVNSLRGKLYAIDYETDRDVITDVALADKQDSWLITEGGLAALPAVRDLLVSTPGIAHSAIYEYKITSINSINTLEPTDIAPLYDTRVMNWCLTNMPGTNRLKPLTRRVLGRDALDYDDIVPKGGSIRDVPADLRARYAAAGDARNTYDLFVVFREELIAAGLWRVYNEIERPLTPVLAEMELAGLTIDRAKVEEMALIYYKKQAELRQQLRELGFNKEPTPDNWAKWFYEELGIPKLKLTDSGSRGSIDSKTLELIRLDYPAVDTYLALQGTTGLLSKFIYPVLCLPPGQTRVDFSLNQTSTRTGRLSSSALVDQLDKKQSGFNMQQWPPAMKQVVIAEPGELMWCRDYSQIEPRIAAVASGDEKMLWSYAQPRLNSDSTLNLDADPYIQLGLDMGFDRQKTITKDDVTRRTIKGVFLGWMYSAGSIKMQETCAQQGVRISVAECSRFKASLEERRPRFVEWRNDVIREARERGASLSLYGRRRLLPQLHSKDPNTRAAAEREAVNMVCQGTASDVIKLAMPKVAKLVKQAGGKLHMQVHDELIGTLPESVDLGAEIDKVMSECEVVPVLVEGGSGRSWYEAKRG